MVSDIRKLYLMNFIFGVHFFGAITVPFFVEWGGLNFTQITLIQAWFMLWMFILEVPTGVVADRFGRRTSLMIAGLSFGSACILYTRAPDITFFLAGEFLFAVGLTLYSGADKALLYEKMREAGNEKEATSVFSKYNAFRILGISLGLPMGSLMASMMVWPYPDNLAFPFFISFVPAFIYSLISLSVNERVVKRKGALKIGIRGVGYLVRDRKLRFMATEYALISSTCFFMFWLYQPLLGMAGFGLEWYGIFAAAFNIMAFIVLLKLGDVEKRIGPRTLLLITGVVSGLVYIITGSWTVIWTIIPAIFLITIAFQVRRPIFSHYINRNIKKDERATILSGVSMIERISTAIMYPFVGIMMDASLSYAMIMLGVLTIFFSLTIRSEVG